MGTVPEEAPIFKICSASADLVALIGANPTRLYPFGQAPQGVLKPYVVWQEIAGNPFNFLDQVPGTDKYNIQLTVYDGPQGDVNSVVKALAKAIEPVAHITAWLGSGTDPVTKNLYRHFAVTWIVYRTD